MPWIVQNLWLIPVLPMLAAGVSALLPQRRRALSAGLAIGSMILSFLLSLCAFAHALKGGEAGRQVFNFEWLQFAGGSEGILKLGWMLDPLTAVMLVMVTLVGSLIFIYSVGYMAHDQNFTRFFTFLSLFAGAMLGVVIANSLLLLFICWELVGLTSYLLIGFWYHKPSAAAAAKKAFVTTRIGDVALLLGMVWLYSETGTLLFYDDGRGCLEHSSLVTLVTQAAGWGMAASTAIGLLIFAGAVGKSGQVPLHVWLPDAMEGPTPVSALIHAATMVAAGVFLVARVYPLMAATPDQLLEAEIARLSNRVVVAGDAERTATPAISMSEAERDQIVRRLERLAMATGADEVSDAAVSEAPAGNGQSLVTPSTTRERDGGTLALTVVTWVGAITALFAASIALAQTDIKRILAYSTVSQLGYMMMGIGVGGVAVGMFHLITHAFFKALLFMGAGSVIHGAHEEQDIRRMGGLRKFMPVTFVTYAIGMLALSGFPLLFSGFWSKDAILHAAHGWHVSHVPFYLGLIGALFTAFYMTRQMAYVFFGECRLDQVEMPGRGGVQKADKPAHVAKGEKHARVGSSEGKPPHVGSYKHHVHESPKVMTVPLMILAVFAIVLGFVGTPAWPWFQRFLGADVHEGFGADVISMMALSTVVVALGLGLGWWFYGRKPLQAAEHRDPLEELQPEIFALLRQKYYIDEIYDRTVVAFNAWWARMCNWLETWIWSGGTQLVSYAVVGVSWVNRVIDEYVVNLGFDQGCKRLRLGGRLFSRFQSGRVQTYLRVIGVALAILVLLLIRGGAR